MATGSLTGSQAGAGGDAALFTRRLFRVRRDDRDVADVRRVAAVGSDSVGPSTPGITWSGSQPQIWLATATALLRIGTK